MTQAQKTALVQMMNAIIAVPWCPPDILGRARTLLRKLGVASPVSTFDEYFENVFGGGAKR